MLVKLGTGTLVGAGYWKVVVVWARGGPLSRWIKWVSILTWKGLGSAGWYGLTLWNYWVRSAKGVPITLLLLAGKEIEGSEYSLLPP